MPLTVEDWLDEIDTALEYRRIFACEDSWGKIEKNYKNDPESDTVAGPNLTYAMCDTLLASLNVPDPEFVISPESPSGVDRAPVVEYIDNWLVRKLKMRRVVDMACLHSFLFSKGIIKIGYDSEFGWNPYYDVGNAPRYLGMTLTQFDKKGARIESPNTEPGMPWISVCHPKDILVPWGTGWDLESAPWIAHRVIRDNDYIKKDPKYSKTKKLEPQISMESFMETYKNVLSKKTRLNLAKTGSYQRMKNPKYNELWEIHDRMSGEIIVVTRDYDEFLRKDANALEVAGASFVDLNFTDDALSYWSTPLAYYLGQLQQTECDIAVQSTKQRRINNLKFLMDEKMMTEEEATNFISGDTGAIGRVNTSGRSIRDCFVSAPQGNQMSFELDSRSNHDNARETLGFSPNQMGDFAFGTRRSATEAAVVNQSASLRSSRKMNRIVDCYITLAQKLNQICFSFWQMPRYAMVEHDWVRFNPDELRGDYLYDVTLSTKRNISRAQRKMEAMALVGQLIQVPGIDLKALYKYAIDAASDPAFERIFGAQSGGAPNMIAQNSMKQQQLTDAQVKDTQNANV